MTSQMDDVFGEVVQSMPVQLVEPVERMVNRDVRYRPTMQYFMSVSVSLSVCLYVCLSVCLSLYNTFKTTTDRKTSQPRRHTVKIYASPI